MTNDNKKRHLTAEEQELRKLAAHEKDQTLQTYLKTTGHRMPRTRREFLASGVLSVGGFIAAPSILQLAMGSATANAQVPSKCPGEDVKAGMIPFVHVNLAGGASLMSNVVSLDLGGQLLPTYRNMGLGTPNSFQVIREFNNVPFPALNGVSISGILTGIRAGAANPDANNEPTALAKTAFINMCVRSLDDTVNNRYSAMGLVAAAGLSGADLPNIGTRNTMTGVGQQPAIKAPPAPLIAGSLASIQSALSPSGILASQLTNKQHHTALMRTIRSLSESQKRVLASTSSTQTLSKLVDCALGKNISLAEAGSNGIDPRQDPTIAAAWGINTGTAANNADVVRASLAYNALNGKAGAVAIDNGGYDYHNSSRAVTTQRDTDAGRLIGRILRTAEIMNKPVFIHVTSDGAVGSATSDDPQILFTGDRGSAGTTYVIAFDPAGRPATTGHQVGGFTAGQVADDTFVKNWTAERAAVAVFANYLKLNGRIGLLGSLVGDEGFSSSELAKVVKFA